MSPTQFELAAGHHRVEAARSLGHATLEAHVENYSDVELWSVGSSENATQRGDYVSAALDSCAGLIKLLATLVLNGRDGELMAIVAGNPLNNNSEGSKHSDAVSTIRGHIEKGIGVGSTTILAAHNRRGTAAKLAIVREAIATLKSSGEHDRIIAAVAAEVEERVAQAGKEAEHRAAEAENTVWKDFLPSEAYAITEALRAEVEAAASVRKGTLNGKSQLKENCLKQDKGQTRDVLARRVGVSGKTLDKIKSVVEAARDEPEKYSDLQERMDKSRSVDGAYLRVLKPGAIFHQFSTVYHQHGS